MVVEKEQIWAYEMIVLLAVVEGMKRMENSLR